jgi:hypothetical protein
MEKPTSDLDRVLSGERLSINEDDIVPGTVHLVDMEGILHLKKDASIKDIILQPQPSSNPNDPLLWLKTKKRCQFLLLLFWSFMISVC